MRWYDTISRWKYFVQGKIFGQSSVGGDTNTPEGVWALLWGNVHLDREHQQDIGSQLFTASTLTNTVNSILNFHENNVEQSSRSSFTAL